jgi:hypothetical protein
MISRRRLSCMHESGHIVGARSQRLVVLRAEVPLTGTMEGSDGYARAAGKTHFAIRRALLPRYGARAAIALLAGGLMEKFAGGPDWIESSTTDFAQVIESLRYTKTEYAELLRKTEEIVAAWFGLASRIADYLEVYGELDARKINEIYSFR